MIMKSAHLYININNSLKSHIFDPYLGFSNQIDFEAMFTLHHISSSRRFIILYGTKWTYFLPVMASKILKIFNVKYVLDKSKR